METSFFAKYRASSILSCFIKSSNRLSIILSFAVNVYFGYILVIYLVFNFLYSKILKEVVIIDVFCISVFFLLRIISGGIVTEIQLSHWIIIMSTLLTLFLGFNKRRQELRLFGGKAHNHRRVLTKYSVYFIDYMIKVSTFLILISYILYTVDARTIMISGTKNLTYTIPFVCCGIFRYLYLINKVKSDGDPVYILFSDRIMQLSVALWVVVFIGVIYFRF